MLFMCTLVVAVGVSASLPLVVAANRDELLARPAVPPFLWPGAPRVVAPRDEVALGTWLGLNENALFVGVTNRAGAAPDRSLRSRGALVAEALRAPSAAVLHERLATVDPRAYNSFHLLYADRVSAHLTWSDGAALHRADLAPGVHVVTERSFGAADDRRGELVRRRWDDLHGDLSPAALGALLARHDEDPFAATCVHLDAMGYGTRSSLILMLGAQWVGTHFLWAEGRPCVTPFAPQTALIDALSG
jgi:Transport and Golgi organisation 2